MGAAPAARVAMDQIGRKGGQAHEHVLSPVDFRCAVLGPFSCLDGYCLARSHIEYPG